MSQDLVLGVTGASGAVYFLRLLEVLLAAGRNVHMAVSASGRTVLYEELGLTLDADPSLVDRLLAAPLPFEDGARFGELLEQARAAGRPIGRLHHYDPGDFMAPIASGSFLTGGMVVCPCSGATVSGIAHGASQNLIQRAADVHLKEGRKLVLVPRETPLSIIQLDNMRRCVEAGAVMLPAMPGFYHRPRSIRDLVDFVVSRICDQLRVPVELMKRWGVDRLEAGSE